MIIIILLIIFGMGSFYIKRKEKADDKQFDQLVKIDSQIKYKDYDLDNDGWKDEIFHERNENNMEVFYLNGKKIQEIDPVRGAKFYLLQKQKGEIYLFEEFGQFHSSSVILYRYEKDQFKMIASDQYFDQNTFRNDTIEKYENDCLIISSSLWYLDTMSFQNTDKEMCIITEYMIKNGKIACVNPYSTITDKNRYIAKQDFSTSSDPEKTDQMDGVHVKKGEEVMVERVYFFPECDEWAYEINVKNKKGWFKDSKEIQFR